MCTQAHKLHTHIHTQTHHALLSTYLEGCRHRLREQNFSCDRWGAPLIHEHREPQRSKSKYHTARAQVRSMCMLICLSWALWQIRGEHADWLSSGHRSSHIGVVNAFQLPFTISFGTVTAINLRVSLPCLECLVVYHLETLEILDGAVETLFSEETTGSWCTTEKACGNSLSNGSGRSGAAHVPGSVDWKRARAISLLFPLLLLLHFFLAGNGAIRRGEGSSGSRDHSLVSSLKWHVSRRNLISQSAHPGIDIISHFLNTQHRKVAHATQTFFSSDAQLRSCQQRFSHYRQPPSLHQSIHIFEWFVAANAKALVFLHLIYLKYGLPQLRRSTVVIDTLHYSCKCR